MVDQGGHGRKHCAIARTDADLSSSGVVLQRAHQPPERGLGQRSLVAIGEQGRDRLRSRGLPPSVQVSNAVATAEAVHRRGELAHRPIDCAPATAKA
jgi:hypothetical protein